MSEDSSKKRRLDLSDFGLGKWRAVLHDESPLEKKLEGDRKGRDRYSPKLEEVRGKKGLYLWLYPINERDYRFIHVGLTKRCLRSRTLVHCRNQLTIDRVYSPEFGGTLGHFGRLGDDLRREPGAYDSNQLKDKALEFLANIHILFLLPISENPTNEADKNQCNDIDDRIRQLEGLIAYRAAELLNGAITNTLLRTRAPEANAPLTAEALASKLNGIVTCLPSTVTADEY